MTQPDRPLELGPLNTAYSPFPAGRRPGDEGAIMTLEQTIAKNVAEILEA
jgi:hypothetical protein